MVDKNNNNNGHKVSRRQRILELLEKGKTVKEITDTVMKEFADRKPDSKLVMMQIRVNAKELGYALK